MITIYNGRTRGLYPPFFPSSTTFPADPFSLYTEAYASMGLGALKDFRTSPLVTEVLNGQYYLEFEYVINGLNATNIEKGNIIKAPTKNGYQLFRIDNTIKTLNGIKVSAKHIANDLNNSFVEDVYPTEKTGQDALDWVLTRTQHKHSFTAWSDITALHSARYVRKNVFSDVFFNADNSIINTWGGEFEFDNLVIKLWSQRGSNNGVKIRDNKNLTGLEINEANDYVTRIMPVGNNGLLLPEKYIDSPLINKYNTRAVTKAIDVYIGVTEDITEEQAFALIRAYVQTLFDNGIDLPTVKGKIDFVELSKTEEYKNYACLETVSLGDTITVYSPKLNVDMITRIISTTYDCIQEKIISLELGV